MKEIELTQGYKAMVDDEDFERVNQYKWCVSKRKDNKYTNYSMRKTLYNNKLRTILMHRFIMDIVNSKVLIDHIDHNGLNNQKSNLRLCSSSQNSMNQMKYKGTSIFKGVHWDKYKNRWKSEIRINNKNTYIGVFKTELEAAIAYNNVALKFYGEYANINIF